MQLFKKKSLGSEMNIIIISNEQMKNVMKIVKCLKESGLLIKDVRKTIRTETKVLLY